MNVLVELTPMQIDMLYRVASNDMISKCMDDLGVTLKRCLHIRHRELFGDVFHDRYISGWKNEEAED